MRLGMVGLGRMGANMAERLRAHGHEVLGYDRRRDVSDVAGIAELVAALRRPRVVWVMVPAGDPTEAVITHLAELLSPGDVIVEGGNSNWNHTVRRAHATHLRGIGYVDAGVSGGVWGRENGYCLMVGGAAEHVAVAQPAFDALAAPGGFAHLGGPGAGHFAKMVHNGIEYGLMQAYAEGYDLLRHAGLDLDVDATIEVWRHGSVIRSWLLDLIGTALQQRPGLADIAGVAQDSGEGRWMLQAAVDRGVPLPAISAALFARFASRQPDSLAMRLVAALREQFGGHAVLPEDAPGDVTPGDVTPDEA
jgi:6-phosphogluconate dehydrogenase